MPSALGRVKINLTASCLQLSAGQLPCLFAARLQMTTVHNAHESWCSPHSVAEFPAEPYLLYRLEFKSRRQLTTKRLSELSHTVKSLVWTGSGTNVKRDFLLSSSEFMSLYSSSLLYLLLRTLSPHSSLMPLHLSMATGRKPEPLVCCQSERRRGSILLANAKWTTPSGQTILATGGPLGMESNAANVHYKTVLACMQMGTKLHHADTAAPVQQYPDSELMDIYQLVMDCLNL